MALDNTTKARLQKSLGIGTDQAVFTDAELADLYEWASSDFEQTMVYAITQLMANAAKLADYTAGQTSEDRSQVFKQLGDLRDWWQQEVAASPQVVMAGTKLIPPRNRAMPRGFADFRLLKVEES